MSTTSHTPKDAKIMAAILKDCGINEYEPRVMNQMLEFAYRYISDLLDDAKVYSDYAGKKQIDADDVKLAVQLKVDSMFTNPPPKELLLEIAKEKNSLPLPPLKQQSGLKLPPDRYCLTQPNYRLKAEAHHTVVAPSDSNKPVGRFQASGLSVKKEPSPGLSIKKELIDGTVPMHAVQSAPSLSQAAGLSGVQPVRSSGSTTSADQPPASITTGAVPFAPAKPLFRLVSGNETGGSVGSSSGLKRKFEQLDEDYDKM